MLAYNLMYCLNKAVLPLKRNYRRLRKQMGLTIPHILLLVRGKLVNISGRLKLRCQRSWYYQKEFEGAKALLT
jgi:hypothetical protein